MAEIRYESTQVSRIFSYVIYITKYYVMKKIILSFSFFDDGHKAMGDEEIEIITEIIETEK